MTDPRICTSCGKGHVEPLRRSGRTMVFRNFDNLELPESLPIPTCSHCGDEWYDSETTAAVELALEEAAAAVLKRLASDQPQHEHRLVPKETDGQDALKRLRPD